ncbi:hypothetical protein PPSIR1_06511 [Plesiocystis pacifica SIR-1]|uniref:Uncharacterized protein n=1 Tax=Plesiocystis pacifica SIR-1 TaxID=391625 RepID=A6GI12_9BACT|nr:RebB family R body protein [Plesiocystis pacifica]EDM74519.1 hypothetical protein PPSIR1_06511 [Plesiocystis pacifica SIR-1]
MPTTVNPQVVDAVTTTQGLVFGKAEALSLELVRAQVTQSLGLAITDATDYMRNMSAISSAAAGVAFKKLLEDPTDAGAAAVLTQANTAVQNATANLTQVGTAVASVLEAWPSAE